MNRLHQYIETKRERNEKLLSVYLTAGYPDLQATLPLLQALSWAGADLIELGVPFSDPLADGATIQAASQQALVARATLPRALDIAGQFTREAEIPLLLMGYANPFIQFGWDDLIRRAEETGVAGYIIPDFPPEESTAAAQAMQARGQSLIHLVAPNTSPARIAQIDEQTTSFIYAVSITGVTGARDALPEASKTFVRRLVQAVSHPVLVGFGISGAAGAREMAALADGIIVGSALLDRIAVAGSTAEACTAAAAFTRELKTAISG